MKKAIIISPTSLLLMLGCTGNKPSSDNVITVDITKNYPEKELILQDFMDVEYIPLESNDEFVTQGKVVAIGEEVLLITNWANDGYLFVFDRKTGKGLKKINRKGQLKGKLKEIAADLDEESNPVIMLIKHKR